MSDPIITHTMLLRSGNANVWPTGFCECASKRRLMAWEDRSACACSRDGWAAKLLQLSRIKMDEAQIAGRRSSAAVSPSRTHTHSPVLDEDKAAPP